MTIAGLERIIFMPVQYCTDRNGPRRAHRATWPAVWTTDGAGPATRFGCRPEDTMYHDTARNDRDGPITDRDHQERCR